MLFRGAHTDRENSVSIDMDSVQMQAIAQQVSGFLGVTGAEGDWG